MTELTSACEQHRRRADDYLEVIRDVPGVLDQDIFPIKLDGEDLHRIDTDVRRFRMKDCKPHFTIAFAGGFSAGKSHLINAMLGREILPQSIRDTTFLPTIVRSGPGSQERATVRYLTGPEIADIFNFYREKCETYPWPHTVDEAQMVSKDDVERLISALPEDRQERRDIRELFAALHDATLSGYVHEEAPFERPIEIDEIERFVVRSSNLRERYLASSVVINLPEFPFGTQVELIDLPGIDAADAWAKKITLRYIKDVDAMVLVAPCDRPFAEAGAQLLSGIKEWGGRHMERLFFVQNKADLYASKDPTHVLDAHVMLQSRLEDKVSSVEDARIVYTSALAALGDSDTVSRIERIPSTENAELDALLDNVRDSGGVHGFVEQLKDYLRDSATKVKIEALRDRWDTLLKRVSGPAAPAIASAQQAAYDKGRRKSERLQKALAEVQTAVEKSTSDLSRDTASIVQGMKEAQLVEELRDRLTDSVTRACERQRPEADASEAAHAGWRTIREEFNSIVHQTLRKGALDDFLVRWQRSLEVLLNRLGNSAPSDDSTTRLPSVPTASSERLFDAVRLRLDEAIQDLDQGIPYGVPPPGTLFSKFEPVFKARVQQVLHNRIRQLITRVQEFLPFHLNWHLNELVRRTRQFTQSLGDSGLLVSSPGLFANLLEDDGEKKVEELSQALASLGKRLDSIRDHD